jgi:Zn finger protein HypA/HybF involved in hydrogenase expression
VVVFYYKKIKKGLDKKGVKMIHYIEYNSQAWCDKCTQVVTTIDGEEKGAICPTCQTGFYLESVA